jgi:hypothetical protein
METAVQVLKKMENILDELIVNAEKLKNISLNGFSEAAVAPLQQNQELLVQRLNGLEGSFEAADKNGLEAELAKMGDRIAKKLRYFQALNNVFVQNISEGNFLEDYHASQKPILPQRPGANEILKKLEK